MTGAEAVGLAALGWVASPIVEELVNKGISYLGSDIAKGLEDLQTTHLPQFQLTIQAAQNSSDKNKLDMLAKWLARLKNAYYDAEAILHEMEYKRLKRKAKGDRKKLKWVRISSHPIFKPLATVMNTVKKKTSPVMKPLKKFTRKVNQKVSLLSPQKKRLWDQLNNLKKIAAEAKDFRELLGTRSGNECGAPAVNKTSDTSSLLSHNVFGRDEVRDQIIKFLLDEQGASSSTKSYSVVAITGIGGAGKTTLAQYIYTDERIQNHFVVRMWLCLSKDKEAKERIRDLIECATGKECPNLRTLDALQNELRQTLLESKSILLILDDLWYDDKEREKQWDDLLAPFAFIRGRCKIVVTCRSTLVPNALEPEKHIMLSDLAPDDFKSLFMHYAIDGLKLSDPQLENDLCEIGDQIVTKMSKSPLAAKIVGSQLRKHPEKRFWRDTQENDNLTGSTMDVLQWSYQHFDVQLQRCFLFCGVFPKGTQGRDGFSFVRYWVALDFIQPLDDNKNVDDIGFEYFNMMVANSIFQLVDGKYFMHDLFRDLAKKLSAGDCFRVKNFEKGIPSTALYAYLKLNEENWIKNLSSICNSRNLRALIVHGLFNSEEDVNEFLTMVSTNLKNLRSLTIWSTGYIKLPRVVGDLINLRYLNVLDSSIEELPDSVSQLYHLQFLLLPTSIKALPTKLSDLIKLRHIGIYDQNLNIFNTLPPVPYLGKLTSLQYLSKFHVRNEEGYELWQLGSLKEIAGSLRIVNLENVKQKDEAIEAKLIEKPKLKRLELVWAESSKNVSDLEVIEALQPAEDLEYLSIEGYGGSRCPSWLLEGSFLNNIKHLKFYNCYALTSLPPNFHLLCHYLTDFRVSKCPCLIYVCENELQLNDNEELEEYHWTSPMIYNKLDLKNVFLQEIQSFKKTDPEQNCGEKLKIIECAVDDSIPALTNDVKLAWWHCHQQRMNFIFRCKTGANKLILPSILRVLVINFCCISDATLSDCLRGMTALEELNLEGIMTITTLPSVKVLKFLESLRILMIKSCWRLRSLDGLHALPNLENFTLESCWSLDMRSDHPELPLTLQSFIIGGCKVSQAILKGNFPSLQRIVINGCAGLTVLSFHHLTSLKSLELINCPGLHLIQTFVPRSSIDSLSLVLLPDLNIESVLESWQGCRQLKISSSVMLNQVLLSENFDAIQNLLIVLCGEEAISFEKSDHLRSIKKLGFHNCELKNLPSTLSDFSKLKMIYFNKCSRISSLPELPKSVQVIRIEDCPELKERCQPNGPDWYKIQHIEDKLIR